MRVALSPVNPASYLTGAVPCDPTIRVVARPFAALLEASNVGSQVVGVPSRGQPGALRRVPDYMPQAQGEPVTAMGSYTPLRTRMGGKARPETPPDTRPSSINRSDLLESRMQTIGRDLRGFGGFGAVPDSTGGDTWSGSEPNKLQAAQDDDYVGSGIFDGPGAPATGNAGQGIFASSFALPGYLYREHPNHPSEVVDVTTGMPVIFRPAAGTASLWETREAYDPWDLETERLYSNQRALPPARLPEVPATRPLSGYGSAEGDAVDTDTVTFLKYAAGGALLGLAAAMVYRQFIAKKGGY